MKIAYVTVSMPFGPLETFLIPEAVEILQQGHDLTIIPRSAKGCISNRDAEPLSGCAVNNPILSLEIMAIFMAYFLRRPIPCIRSISFVFKLSELRHLLKNILVIPKAFWFANYIEKHGIEHIHCHWALTTATMSMIASKLSHVPWSMTCHRGDIAGNNLLNVKIASASFTRFISSNGVLMARNLKALTSDSRTYIGRMGVVVPNEIEPFNLSNPVLICPANLLPVKGHKYLLQAVEICKQKGLLFKLKIAGSGPLKNDLTNLAHELSLEDYVEFLGHVPHHDLLSWYSDGKISGVVLPSIDLGDNLREGVPVSLVEALAYGVPVISTRTGAIPELLDGIGVLVPDKNPQALADAIALLMSDEVYRQNLISSGRAAVLKEYDVKKTAADLIARIEKCS